MLILVLVSLSLASFIDCRSNNPIQTRVLGGKPSRIGEFPYMVSLQILLPLNNDTAEIFKYFHICGGALISADTVLTAAHCTYGKWMGDLSVLAGTTVLEGSNLGIRRKIKKIIQHSSFNMVHVDNDISILILEKGYEIGENFKQLEDGSVVRQPIRTISMFSKSDELPVNRKAYIMGWGQDYKDPENGSYTDGDYVCTAKPKMSNVLKYATVPVWDPNICEEEVTRLLDSERNYLIRWSNKTFCAGNEDGQIKSCIGDSGGPVVVNRKLLGIVSYGFGCGKPTPTLYTNVINHHCWIRNHTSW